VERLVPTLGRAWLTKDFIFAPTGKFCPIISAGRQGMRPAAQDSDNSIHLILFDF
jgi:hypothetical protein